MNLLFIDDDKACNFFHQIIVEEFGKAQTYTFFNDPSEGINYLVDCKENERKFPNFIFLDLNMPKMDGWDFLKAIAERNINPPTIFILSTSLNPSDKQRALENPLVYDFICKPLSLDTLESLELVKE
ncbi:MAG: response regulator [Bacteroidota bacterium]